jgi:hypothetical protein
MQKMANNQMENTIEMHIIIRIVWSDEPVVVPLFSSTNGENDNPMIDIFLNSDRGKIYKHQSLIFVFA